MDLVSPGDTFSGTASFDSCLEGEDHPVTIIANEVAGNVFRGAAVAKYNDRVRSRAITGFFYVPGRKVVIAPEGYGPKSMSLACSHDADSLNDMDCQITTSFMSETCGDLGLSRDPRGNFLFSVFVVDDSKLKST